MSRSARKMLSSLRKTGYCVDCNYRGALDRRGGCPRCGSDWTSASRDEDEVKDDLEGLNLPGALCVSEYLTDESYEL